MIALAIALAFLGILAHNTATAYVKRRWPLTKSEEVAALEKRVGDLAETVEKLSAEKALSVNAAARRPTGMWADGGKP